jgi:hypothetical protein
VIAGMAEEEREDNNSKTYFLLKGTPEGVPFFLSGFAFIAYIYCGFFEQNRISMCRLFQNH